jgi:hypothetical protein
VHVEIITENTAGTITSLKATILSTCAIDVKLSYAKYPLFDIYLLDSSFGKVLIEESFFVFSIPN